jgi:glyoxalase family protein
MKLEGIHHITAITADGPANVEFYAHVLGLRMVKRTVNLDDPTAYQLYYADEAGSPGADLTFFEYPGARRGHAGAGMVHRIVHRVGSGASLDFWEARVGGERVEDGLRFADPEGLEHELRVVQTADAPLRARSLEIPDEHALQGFEAVHASVADPAGSEALLTGVLGFAAAGAHAFEARGDARGGSIAYEPPRGRGIPGAGTVHHVAWATLPDEHDAWRERVSEAGVRATPVIDRVYYKSVYFREPGGILCELATIGPGFTGDEPAEHLGERLSLPPRLERLRPRLEHELTPLPDTRPWRPAPART